MRNIILSLFLFALVASAQTPDSARVKAWRYAAAQTVTPGPLDGFPQQANIVYYSSFTPSGTNIVDLASDYDGYTENTTETNDAVRGTSLYHDGTATSQTIIPLMDEFADYSNLTFSVWAKLDTTHTQVRHILRRNSSNGLLNTLQLKTLSDGTVQIILGGGGLYAIATTSSAIPEGEWINYCITFKSATAVKLYTNGVFAVEDTSGIPTTGNHQSGYPHYFGNFQTKNNTYWLGPIDEPVFWDVELTPTEVYQVYTRDAP